VQLWFLGSKIMIKLLIQPDPGFIRLKLAFRALATCVIAAAICLSIGKLAILTAILAGMFAQTAIYGNTTYEKFFYGLLMTFCFSAAYAIGVLSRDIPFLADALMVIGGFFVFYCKRFGPAFMVMPLFTWVIYFMATIFQVPTLEAWLGISGIAIASGIAVFISLFIFPDRKNLLFIDRIKKHLSLNEAMLIWLKQSLTHTPQNPKQAFRKHFFKKHHKTLELLTDNLALANTFTDDEHNRKKNIDNFLMYEAAMMKANGMLGDSLRSLFCDQPSPAEQEILASLKSIICQLTAVLHQLRLDKKNLKLYFPKHLPNIDERLDALKTQLCVKQKSSQTDLIYFFNCYTSLLHYWKNLYALRSINVTFN